MALRAFLLSCVFFGTVLGGLVQKPNLVVPPSHAPHRETAKTIFLDSYKAYKDYAWTHDDVTPLSKSFRDSRNGWGATIVDAMSTLHIMGLDDLFAEAVNFSSTIDFRASKSLDTVSVFETTIRFLGGLLSAYELSGQKYPSLLAKAKEVGDKMAFAWVGGNDIPYGWLNFTTDTPKVAITNIAEAGTLTLEWETLSKHTGNETYKDLVLRSVRQVANLPSPLPGLAVTWIDPTISKTVGGYITWGGGADSYFEYLIKHARLSNTDDDFFADTWATAIDSSIRSLMRKSTVGNHTYLADYDSAQKIRHVGSHLACFHGGNWLMGGKLLNNQTIIDYGLQLVDGCWNTYASTLTGIGPESFGFISEDGDYTGDDTPPSDSQIQFYNKNGYYIRSSAYIHRPEVLESNFYAWRVTGNTKYLDRAASAMASFNKYLRTAGGFAGLWDVNYIGGGMFDSTESFWFAETLKYLYLTFDDPNHISVDEYVFNTEAHPFKAPPPKARYGSGRLRNPTEPFTLRTPPPGPYPAVSTSPAVPTSQMRIQASIP